MRFVREWFTVQLGYGLTGLGRVSARHINAIAEIEDARVVAVADTNPEKVARACDRCGGDAACYEDYHELLANPAVDVAVVMVPTQMHPEVTVAALEAGRHVYCEKAMAASIGGCRQMIEARDRTDRLLMIGQSTRFRPPFAMARRLIDRGEIGDIVAVDGAFTGPANTPEQGATDSWRYRAESAGNGHIINFGCHYIDTARFLCGEDPVSVSAVVNNRFSPGMIQEDQFSVIAECDGGVIITIAMYCTPEPVAQQHQGLTIFGTAGVIEALWRPDRVILKFRDENAREVPMDHDLRENYWTRIHRQFKTAIEEGGPVPVTGEDAMRNVEWGLAAYLSSTRREWVDLPLPDELADYCGPQLEQSIPPTRE
ncbi:MAG: Gfo/Idh/MocA family protein [Armatimonadota bacterium]